MDDLFAFLRARYAEEEELARAADVRQGDPEWWVSPVAGSGGEHFTVRSKRDNRPIARVQRIDGDNGEPGKILHGEAVADHIARHDPKRTLDDIASKLAVLGFLDPTDLPEGEGKFVAGMTLRLLAWAYRSHPDYRQEWRPTRQSA